MLRWKSAMAAFVALAAPVMPATASWQKAETRHFVIYSQERPAVVRAYADRLERFDQAARLVLRKPDPDVGLGNRVHIYVLPDDSAVRAVHQGGDRRLFGFYLPRYSGPVAFVPADTGPSRPGMLSADSVFFHEYAHHLMWQDIARPYPNWYVEGFAELIGSPRFGADGSVTFGIAPQHRAASLIREVGLSLAQMLQNQPERLTPDQRESLYAQGWLLTHYLTFEPARAGQLNRYLDALVAGKGPAEAAALLGDIGQLDRELAGYKFRRKLPSLNVDGAVLAARPVTITPLTEGADKAMAVHLRVQRGLRGTDAADQLTAIRGIAARYPSDPFVQRVLAQAALAAGSPDIALAAADAALAASPQDGEALIARGKALLARPAPGSDDLRAARRAFIAANRLDTEDPEPLVEYYRSFRGADRPTPDALKGLHYAAALMPGDSELRFQSALALLRAGDVVRARAALMPIAYNPHGGARSDRVRTLLDRLDRADAAAALAATGQPPAPNPAPAP